MPIFIEIQENRILIFAEVIRYCKLSGHNLDIAIRL